MGPLWIRLDCPSCPTEAQLDQDLANLETIFWRPSFVAL